MLEEYNNFLKSDYIRIFILIITNVFMGYTLQPVPKWLNDIFDTSQIFKFVVIFLATSVAFYPISSSNIIWITFGSIIALVLFELFRQY